MLTEVQFSKLKMLLNEARRERVLRPISEEVMKALETVESCEWVSGFRQAWRMRVVHEWPTHEQINDEAAEAPDPTSFVLGVHWAESKMMGEKC